MEEMRQSLRIIQQAVEQMPAGKEKLPVPLRVRPPKGEVYTQIESPRGHAGLLPCFRTARKNPTAAISALRHFINLTVLRELLVGQKLADAILIFRQH